MDHNKKLTLDWEGFLDEGDCGHTLNGRESSSKRRQQRQSRTRHLAGKDEGEDVKFERVLEGKASILG